MDPKENEQPGEGGTPAPPTPSEGATPPAPDAAAILAENERLKAQLKKVNASDAERRHKLNEERDAKLKALEEKGEFEVAKKLLEEKLADATGYEADALAYRKAQQEAAVAFESRVSEVELPAYVKAGIDAASSVTEKGRLLDAYLADVKAKSSEPPPPTKPSSSGGPPPPSSPGSTAEELMAQGVHPSVIREKHPEAWAALRGQTEAPKRTGPIF